MKKNLSLLFIVAGTLVFVPSFAGAEQAGGFVRIDGGDRTINFGDPLVLQIGFTTSLNAEQQSAISSTADWQVYGASRDVILSPSVSSVLVRFTAPGTYVIVLKVNTIAGVDTAFVTITVRPSNVVQPPPPPPPGTHYTYGPPNVSMPGLAELTPPGSRQEREFSISDRVRVIAEGGMNVRDDNFSMPKPAGLSGSSYFGGVAGSIIGQQPFNAQGVVEDGFVRATVDGVTYTFWFIRFDSGVNGWVAGDRLENRQGNADQFYLAKVIDYASTARYPTQIGDRVVVIPEKLFVHVSPGSANLVTDDSIDYKEKGSVGKVIGGPVEAPFGGRSWTWWNVHFGRGPDGWVPGGYLHRLYHDSEGYNPNPSICPLPSYRTCVPYDKRGTLNSLGVAPPLGELDYCLLCARHFRLPDDQIPPVEGAPPPPPPPVVPLPPEWQPTDTSPTGAGQKVRVKPNESILTLAVNVRANPLADGSCGAIIGERPVGALGTTTGANQGCTIGGTTYRMWGVAFDGGPTGWVTRSRLEVVTQTGTTPGGPPPPPPAPSNLQITTPTTSENYTSSTQTLTIGGTKASNLGGFYCTVIVGNNAPVLCSNVQTTDTTWSANVTLQRRQNRITVTASSAGSPPIPGLDSLLVTYGTSAGTPPPPPPPAPGGSACGPSVPPYTHVAGGCYGGYNFQPNCGAIFSPGPTSWPPGCNISTQPPPPPPPAAPPPPPTDQTISDGVRVRVIPGVMGNVVNVRPTPCGEPPSTHTTGDIGTVRGVRETCVLNNQTYRAWNIDFDSGADGWVIQSRLEVAGQ